MGEAPRYLRFFPILSRIVMEPGRGLHAQRLSTFDGTKVRTYSANAETCTGPYTQHELGKPGAGSDTCYPSPGEDQKKFQVILGYLGSLRPAWGHLRLCLKKQNPNKSLRKKKGKKGKGGDSARSFRNGKHHACASFLCTVPWVQEGRQGWRLEFPK